MSALLAFPLANLHQHSYAVIDIGSNSVRMVVYHAPARVPVPLFNEKYYCGLGKGLATSGFLNPEGVTLAKKAIGRFIVMAKRLAVSDLKIIATAAVRDARNGAHFVRDLEVSMGIEIDVISGEREAELAAKGALASMYKPIGITADMGGGSIELAYISRDHIEKQSSFELGTLRLVDDTHNNATAMHDLIRREMSQISWLESVHAKTIYAIGGSFRGIAKMHMKKTNYPLPILHEYRLSRKAIESMARTLKSLSTDDIAGLPGVPEERAITILPAVLMLHQIMQFSHAEHVVFSVTGIREGLIYDQLPPDLQRQDPLIASAYDLASLAGRKGAYAKELFDWMQPLFTHESQSHQRLRMALCVLSELAWTVDPNFRSEWAFLRVVQSAMKGLTHRERVMLGTALYHRYQTKWKLDRPEIKLLDEHDRLWARCVGTAASLAFHLSGGKHGNLYHARLMVNGTRISLELDDEANPLRTETVEKKLEGLGSTFKALSNFVI